MEKLRTYTLFIFPAILAMAAILFFYWWATEQRALFLVCFIIAGVSVFVLFLMHFSKASRIAKRTAGVIIAALTITFFLIGYLFYQFNRTIIRETDLTATLQTAGRYRSLTDEFFLERLRRAASLKDHLTSAPLWNQAKILSGFYDNHPGDYISIHILDTSGISVASAPSPLTYREKEKFRTFNTPTFGEPDFTVTMGAHVEAQLSSIKLFVPYETGEGIGYCLLFNIRFDPLLTIVKDKSPDLSFYLLRNDEVVISNESNLSDRNFKSFRSTGYLEDRDKNIFITRANLTGISWQAVTVQPLDEAFPNVVLADSVLTQVLLMGGLAGIAVGLVLSLYLSRSILSPVSKLSLEAASIADGDLERTIEDLPSRGPDEITELNRAVQKMVGHLKATMGELKGVNEQLRATQEELDAQLTAAQTIQRGLIPANTLRTCAYEVCGGLVMAREVGGDYFDFFEIGRAHIGIILIDAAGKGISGSFYSALIKGITQTALTPEDLIAGDLQKVMHTIEDHFIHARDQRTRTAAMLLAVLDTDLHTMRIVNAGFEMPVRLAGKDRESIPVKGRALGMPSWMGDFQMAEIKIYPNDVIAFFSDGLDDVSVWEKVSAETIAPGDFFSKNEKPSDDISVVLVRNYPFQKLEIRIPSRPDAEREPIEGMKTAMQSAGFNAMCINDAAIAVREALVNAVKHGNRYDAKKTIGLSLLYRPGFAEIRITDEGKGFIWSERGTPDIKKKLEGAEPAGGWGLYVIEKLADVVRIENSRKGTTLIMRFFSAGDPQTPQFEIPRTG